MIPGGLRAVAGLNGVNGRAAGAGGYAAIR